MAVISVLASVIGYAVADAVSDNLKAAIDGFAVATGLSVTA